MFNRAERLFIDKSVALELSTVNILADWSAAPTLAPSLAPLFAHSLDQYALRRSHQQHYDHLAELQKQIHPRHLDTPSFAS